MKRLLWNAVLAMLATMCASLSASAGPVEHADLILRNGEVITMDVDRPAAQAVAIAGDRIAAVGSNDEIDAWTGENTRVNVVEVCGGWVPTNVYQRKENTHVHEIPLRSGLRSALHERRVSR
jgi:adenine deaminase